jgi:hypothetical protein
LAERSEVRPYEAQVGPLGDGQDVIHIARRGDAALLGAEPAERLVHEDLHPQTLPRCVVTARRCGAAPTIKHPKLRAPYLLRVMVRGTMQWRAKRHHTSSGTHAQNTLSGDAVPRDMFSRGFLCLRNLWLTRAPAAGATLGDDSRSAPQCFTLLLSR